MIATIRTASNGMLAKAAPKRTSAFSKGARYTMKGRFQIAMRGFSKSVAKSGSKIRAVQLATEQV